MKPILSVKNLHFTFDTYMGKVYAVRGVEFDLNKGETLAIVGESGSGKSVTSKSLIRLIPPNQGAIEKGEIIFEGKDLAQATERELESIRGSELSMIFQDPLTSLNPTMTVGKQILESIQEHQNISSKEAHEKVIELLTLVGIPNAESRVKQYPHQFSGGMRQRVMISIALACNPKVLIADEPTTALDVTIQAQILDLMRKLQQNMNTSIVLITHDLGVVANMAQKIAVMYGGMIVETGTAEDIFFDPKHPYTWGLLASIPNFDDERTRLSSIDGTPPDLADPPKGCPFAARCPHVMNVCLDEMPEMTESTEGHKAACWLLDERAAKVEPPKEAIIGG